MTNVEPFDDVVDGGPDTPRAPPLVKGRQIAALTLAVVMIAGAWIVRTRLIDGDEDSSGASSSGAVDVVCIDELWEACDSAFRANADVRVRRESANTTLDERGASVEVPDEIWITLQPFPEMADRLRTQNRVTESTQSIQAIASSPMTLVVAAERAETLTIECGDPVDWRCLGSAAGTPWSSFDPAQSGGMVRPAFAPHPDTAIGQLGVASAVLGYFGDGVLDPGDTGLLTWSRQVSRATAASTVAGSTAVAVIQTRPSALDIAVGAVAELTTVDDPRFVLLRASPELTVDVVAAVPAEVSLPDGFVTNLRTALTDTGWEPPQNGGPGVSADDMLAIRRIWEQLT